MTDTIRLSASLADRYRIERELGQGGMATVYLAEDLKHHRQVAIKVLRPELAAVLGAERFVQEITTTAQLQHPHILALFDSGTADSFLYYVMPYVEGETLRNKLDREKQLGVDEAVKIATEVADALDYAHRHGVIHRDIKPENILLHDGRPIVADFGIALAVSAAAGGRMTETGLSLGTPYYMSPEQATAEKEITARSDVYSLASVLYEMLGGQPPHVGGSAQQIIMKIIADTPRPVTELRRSVPPNIAAALDKALERLPADRFATAAEFAAALTNPTFATAAMTTAQGRAAPARRDPRLIGLGVALAAAIGVAAWGWLRSPPPERSQRYRILLTAHRAGRGLVGSNLALAPDGLTIVFSDTVEGHRQLWIKTADRAEAEPLAGTEGATAPAFSPDGAWIAFMADEKVRKVPVTGGSAVTIADSAAVGAIPHVVTWLDGETVAFTDRRFGLSMVGKDGGPTRRFDYIATAGLGVASIAAMPGGRGAILGMCNWGCPTSTLFVADLEAGTLDTLTANGLRAWAMADGRVVFVRQDGGVLAAPFDARRHRFTADPAPVLDGVQVAGYAADMVLTPNGTLLYVPGPSAGGGSLAEVVWVTRDGRATPVDSGWTFVPSPNAGIRLSPDGRSLAIAVQSGGTEEVWIKHLEHGPFARLTLEGSSERPEWSPDGRYVYYMGAKDAAHSDLRRRRADGTGTFEIIATLSRAIWEVQPTRDTTRLIVRLGVPPTRDIYLLDRTKQGDSAITPLVADNRYEETDIGLSPDGRWLVYTSTESGRSEVYVRPFPDVNAGRWQISGEGGTEPHWARNGRELFYRRGDGALVSVAVGSGPSFDAGAQRVLFQAGDYVGNTATADYDITADGRRFLFIRYVLPAGARNSATTAILVQHWSAGGRAGVAATR